jgi:hypothetical protein
MWTSLRMPVVMDMQMATRRAPRPGRPGDLLSRDREVRRLLRRGDVAGEQRS